jgi:hypothetical protein
LVICQGLEVLRCLETKLLIRRDVIKDDDADELVLVKPESLDGP